MLLLFGILLAIGGFAVILLGQGVIGGVLIVLGIAAVAAALLFTAGRSKVVISRDYLCPDDHVIFIDDFLAYGNAAKGIIDLCKQSGATLEGMGFIIEKAFQDGGQYLREQGVRVESLAIIESLENCEIKIKNA